MTIILPNIPTMAVPRPVDTGSWQQPIAGGTTQRIERPGGHMAVDFTTKRLKVTSEALDWLAILVQAINQTVRAVLPQPGVTIGAPGTPVVDGSGQGGAALAARGFTPGYTIGRGWGLNFYDSIGRAYLHIVTAPVTVGGDGKVTIPVAPNVRCTPANGSLINMVPVIEGRMIGADKGLTLKAALTEGVPFTVEELR